MLALGEISVSISRLLGNVDIDHNHRTSLEWMHVPKYYKYDTDIMYSSFA